MNLKTLFYIGAASTVLAGIALTTYIPAALWPQSYALLLVGHSVTAYISFKLKNMEAFALAFPFVLLDIYGIIIRLLQ